MLIVSRKEYNSESKKKFTSVNDTLYLIIWKLTIFLIYYINDSNTIN